MPKERKHNPQNKICKKIIRMMMKEMLEDIKVRKRLNNHRKTKNNSNNKFKTNQLRMKTHAHFVVDMMKDLMKNH